MCIALFVYDVHPALLLLLAFNRDEFWDRPTLPAHFWPDEPTLLAGRDALRKGTWLGMTRSGRFAFLTNYREPMNQSYPVIPSSTNDSSAAGAAADAITSGSSFVKTTTAPSRGALTTDFLTGSTSPLEYLKGLDTAGYCGFNLLVGDLQQHQVAYLSNRGSDGPQLLPAGTYGVSNGLLQQWPKVKKGLAALADCIDLPPPAAAAAAGEGDGAMAAAAAAATAAAAAAANAQQQDQQQPQDQQKKQTKQEQQEGEEAVGQCEGDPGGQEEGEEVPWQELFQRVMGDINRAAAHEVPITGVGEELDHRLSSIFVKPFEMQPGTMYGTRSQTVIAVWRDGRVEQRERYIEKQEQDDPLFDVSDMDDNVLGNRNDAKQEQQQQPGREEAEWVWKEVQHSFTMAQAAAAAASAESSQHLPPQQLEQQQHQEASECAVAAAASAPAAQ